MEIEEYIRTDKGIISKINSCVDIDMIEFENAIIGNVVKHSKNIIDLIEVNDIVNEHKILDIRQNLESGLRYLIYDYVPLKYYVERTDKIKTILTKEQYEQNSFKL